MIQPVPLEAVPIRLVKRSRGLPLGLEQPTDGLRRLIWLYLILWLVEGGLRRWFLPGLATPLLLVRDPVVVAIYLLAASKNLFPLNGFIVGGITMAFLTSVNALAIGHGNALVALYGVRCDFLHVPLIFIMGRVLRQNDLLLLARVAVVLVVPYTALLVAQFYAPQDAWVNRGVGGEGGAGFDGALDRFRPPGTFSFITGPQIIYPLFAAFWFAAVISRQLPFWLLAVSGAAILVAVPISISRSLFLATTIVALTGLGALLMGGRLTSRVLFQVLIAALILPVLAMQIPAFHDGMEAFSARWGNATVEEGGVKVAIVERVLNDLFGSFEYVGAAGLGTGYSTNVGQKMLTQEVGFGASEGEWGRLLFDNGSILGSLLVIFRVVLAGRIALAAVTAWQQRAPLGMVFASAAFLGLLNGQWGQATALGGAVIGGGLTLAAANAFATPGSQPGPATKSRIPRRFRNRRTPATPKPNPAV